jgi:uncharacterized protein YecE (DUF72 family)
MNENNILLGTSGWSYREWVGPFYTDKDKSLLKAYAGVFKTVEIDSTFYRYPSKGTVMGWARYSPEGFVYTAKLPKLITHKKKLDLSQGIQEDLEKFIELMEPLWLGGKLGCLLIQLPPKYDYKPKEFEEFLKILPSHIKFAVEFRDLSWMRDETWALLEKYKVAYAIVDEPLLPPDVHLTTSFAYFRWHGKGGRPWYNYRYGVEELEPWVPKVKQAAEKVKTVYGYFNNHYHGYAVENCLQVLEMLSVLTPEQAEAKNRIDDYFKTSAMIKEPKIEAFAEPSAHDLESLLHAFLDAGRLKRARGIKDDELRIEKETDKRVEATVREYHIVVDFEARTILHDCADWSKMLLAKTFCKHIGKLFLSLDKEKATYMLRKIYSEKDTWQFKPYA